MPGIHHVYINVYTFAPCIHLPSSASVTETYNIHLKFIFTILLQSLLGAMGSAGMMVGPGVGGGLFAVRFIHRNHFS